jgi:outer membrane receptor protein involved in Fe transport
MRNVIFISNIFILFFFFSLQSLLTAVEKGSISGRVTDISGQPIQHVSISLLKFKIETKTDADGFYSLQNVPFGDHLIVFQIHGFAAQNKRMHLSEKSMTLNVELQQSFIETHTIIITGTPTEQDPLSSAADICVMAGRNKSEKQAADLGQTLDDLPGIASIATGSQVGKPVIRGLSSNRIRVLLDEIAMDYQQYGVRHWANVDPFLSQKIEVVKGASSVLYGSDALGGVINVIPRQIPFGMSKNSFLNGYFTSYYFTNNSEYAGGLTLEGLLGHFGFTGTLINRSAGNIQVPRVRTASETGIGTDPKFSGELSYTDFYQLNGSISMGYQFPFGELITNYTRWNNEHNFLLPNGSGIGQNLENDVLNIRGLFFLGSNWIIKSRFNYLQNLRQSNKAGSPRNLLPEDIEIDLLIKNYTGRIQFEHGKIGAFSGQLGIEYLHGDHNTRGIVPLIPAAKISNFSAFLFEEATMGKLIFSLGARFDIRNQEVIPDSRLKLPDPEIGETDDVLKQDYSVFTGSIGASYRFTENLTLAANVGRGFRAPSIFELHIYGEHGGIAAFQIGEPNLKEEISLNTDLSLRWRSPGLQAKATVYRNVIKNYIYLINTGEFYPKADGSQIPIMRATQGDARLVGMDIDLQALVCPWLQISGIFEITEGKNMDNNKELPLLPATKAIAEARFLQKKLGPFKNCWFSIGLRHSWKKEAAGRYEPFWQFDVNQDFGVASTKAYTLLDIGMGFDIKLGEQPIIISLKVKNATNKAYRDFLDTYKGYALSPGRNVQLRLDIPFNIFQSNTHQKNKSHLQQSAARKD